jgi:hypothetical protein
MSISWRVTRDRRSYLVNFSLMARLTQRPQLVILPPIREVVSVPLHFNLSYITFHGQ